VITDLKQRGVDDIFIACIDGLKGFEEAIWTIFPETEVQSCIVHQIRNSLKYAASKDQKVFMMALKPVYKADNESQALDELAKLKENLPAAALHLHSRRCAPGVAASPSRTGKSTSPSDTGSPAAHPSA
jgi:transposase-like protein